MPQMGKPISNQERAYQNVTMAPKRRALPTPAEQLSNEEIASKEKKRLLNKITGFKEKNDLVVDGTKHNRMGKDEFLRLLTVQLQNQDPMNPMKQEKMAAELAQFSQLEQLSNLNEKFDGLTKNQHAQDKFYGASFLGKEVVTAGSSLKFEGEGTEADILYTLPKPADKVLIRVFDGRNNMVGEMWKENIGRGNQTASWDGMQLDQSISAPGEFTTKVFAWDRFADPIDVQTKSTGIVESVFFENGETVLKVDGKKVFLRDVDSFHNPGAKKPQMPSMKPNINVGSNMGSPIGQLRAENNAATNLPIEAATRSKVNLNQGNNNRGMNAYKEQIPTTGITSVYDE
jgi:flagellar basal-body rod modification protein FlgD